MGAQYYELLADRTTLLLQLPGFAACGDGEVRDLVQARLARMWDTVADTSGLDPVTVKSFLARHPGRFAIVGGGLAPARLHTGRDFEGTP